MFAEPARANLARECANSVPKQVRAANMSVNGGERGRVGDGMGVVSVRNVYGNVIVILRLSFGYPSVMYRLSFEEGSVNN